VPVTAVRRGAVAMRSSRLDAAGASKRDSGIIRIVYSVPLLAECEDMISPARITCFPNPFRVQVSRVEKEVESFVYRYKFTSTALADGGPAPGYPGYYQVNFSVPIGVVPGLAVPVHLTYLRPPSNAVTIGVQ
jgi:hypothetical protein